VAQSPQWFVFDVRSTHAPVQQLLPTSQDALPHMTPPPIVIIVEPAVPVTEPSAPPSE
jgi:hypothetical protein